MSEDQLSFSKPRFVKAELTGKLMRVQRVAMLRRWPVSVRSMLTYMYLQGALPD